MQEAGAHNSTIAACDLMQEAGALISTMDGKPYTVFDRSVLASNGRLHDAVRILCCCCLRHRPSLSKAGSGVPCQAQSSDPLQFLWHIFPPTECFAPLVQILAKTKPAVTQLRNTGVDLSRWFVPTGYVVSES